LPERGGYIGEESEDGPMVIFTNEIRE